jgi:hypothetical protein
MENVFVAGYFPEIYVRMEVLAVAGLLVSVAILWWGFSKKSSRQGADHRYYYRVLSLIFIPLAIALVSLSSYSLFFQQRALVDKFKNGQYSIVSGCLQNFSPSKSAGHTPDRVKVGGKTFVYSDNDENGGYHQTEISGGDIHADSKVVLYVVDGVIMRLDIRQHACADAPAF